MSTFTYCAHMDPVPVLSLLKNMCFQQTFLQANNDTLIRGVEITIRKESLTGILDMLNFTLFIFKASFKCSQSELCSDKKPHCFPAVFSGLRMAAFTLH